VIFPDQLAQRLRVKSSVGKIDIDVSDALGLDEGPIIGFSSDPNSGNTYDFVMGLDFADEMFFSGELAELIFGRTGSPNIDLPLLMRPNPGSGGSGLDSDGYLKALDTVFIDFEIWKPITAAMLVNGWTIAAPIPQYYRDPTGQVSLRGRIAPGVTANGTTMLTLPAQYRPTRTYFVPATQDQAPYNQPAVEVQAGGAVTIWSWTAGNMVLDGIQFHLF